MSMLSAQCDKLRERAKTLRQGRWSDGADDARLMEDAADTIWELRCKCAGMVDMRERARLAETENAKLRGLAGELWFYAEQELVCDENCPYGAACDWMEPTVVCVFKRRMRELGVEVDG